ncbi:uncharacterized protein LY89DRAFT_690614 [Mollisia scopiformis]|uniref:DUF6546 domain-containing protein n=1 Tax=Mollisia scopiformis TaxID=149040 RepID=A0A132B9I5_MOLSC|nr:uncharacterized protein LY89DRAFT_690614 [Mollisia scopiformis]KUJ09072.1 hypothetical protein LY89DRAFT_690614 [Mollisia scopiformis]
MSPATLPSEVTSFIISHLLVPDDPQPAGYIQKPTRIAMYATVSKEWQKSVERHTFSNLYLTPTRLQEFGRIVERKRQKYVRRINLDVVLDAYDEVAFGRYESDEDQERNNQVFTRTLQQLFKSLSSWEDDDVADLGVSLSVKVHSPSDLSCLGQMDARARRRRRLIGGPKDLLNRRFDRSYLRFVCSQTAGDINHLLHLVPAISEMDINGSGPRHTWPASCSTIASRTPQLRSLKLRLWDNERNDLELRKGARNEFANSIKSWPPSIQKVDLSYYNLPPQDQSFMPPNILSEPNSGDLISTNLGKFSQQLTELNLDDITIGADFFWNSSFDSLAPHWPHFTSLTVNYNPITPAGQWLRERDNFFRHKASPEHMNNLYTAAGKAASFMPALKELWLSAEFGGYCPHWFSYKTSPTNACATWCSTPEFKPNESVLRIWRDVSRKNLGIDLEIKYINERICFPTNSSS